MSFKEDFEFLKSHKSCFALASEDKKQQIIVSPELQGRVMGSCANGELSENFGWINHELIKSGKINPQINAYGGEDRLWLGPEAGQFGLFFKKGDDFIFDNYQVPPPLDCEPFNLVWQKPQSALMSKHIKLSNYQGFNFNIDVNRQINLLSKADVEKQLNIKLNNSINWVGFESQNELINIGNEAWDKRTGLLSLWSIGMFKASENNIAIIPIKTDNDASINTNYFAPLPDDKIKITDSHVILKCDGNYRSKIGVPPQMAKPIMGSYDSTNNTLTIVQFSFNSNAKNYVNSLWEMQNEPYKGDVINVYNDGEHEGEKLGQFYELESSSPAYELKTGEVLKHTHQTYHFTGDVNEMNEMSRALLGIDLNELAP